MGDDKKDDNEKKPYRFQNGSTIEDIVGEGFAGFKSETVPQKVPHSNLDLKEWESLLRWREMVIRSKQENPMRENE